MQFPNDSKTYPRDLVGYGRNPPDPKWLGNARIAVQFVINYEEGGESSIFNSEKASENLLSEIVGVAPMRDESLNESLFSGLDHARSAIAEWADDYNHFRPHSSLGYQTPADYAEIIAATGSNVTQCGSFAFPPVANTAPFGVSTTADALIAAG